MHTVFHGNECRGKADNDEVVLRLRDTAFTEARRVSLNEEDAHDCAMEMVLHALVQVAGCAAVNCTEAVIGDAPALLPAVSLSIVATHLVLRADLCPHETAKWLRRCARNFALNYRRRIAARRRHEVEPKQNHPADGNGDDENLSTRTAPPAEYDALNQLLHQDVLAAMHELPSHAREVFARFHLDGDSMAEIALSSGKSPDAVRKHLHRMRHHVCTSLVQKGYGEEEPDECNKIASKK